MYTCFSGVMDKINYFNDWSTPDIGFPDRRMFIELYDLYPDSLWNRDRVSDMYRWYEIGVKQRGIQPYNADTGNRQIFDFIIQNSSYTRKLVDEFMHVFRMGILQNWIEPEYVNAGTAPSQLGISIKETISDTANIGSNLYKKTMIAAGVIGGLYLLFYAAPVIFKRKKV